MVALGAVSIAKRHVDAVKREFIPPGSDYLRYAHPGEGEQGVRTLNSLRRIGRPSCTQNLAQAGEIGDGRIVPTLHLLPAA
jgi:hypothetical protein